VKHKTKHSHHKPKRRNAGPVAAPARRRRLQRAPAPDFSTTFASVAGGGGGAVLGGILANQEIMSPETIGLAMTVGGAIGAYTLDGSARIAANGIAAAGAGQLALALMQKRAVKADEKEAKKLEEAPRQGYRSRVVANFQSVAPEVATRLGYVDDDSDEYGD
jgi:hypothetical protein